MTPAATTPLSPPRGAGATSLQPATFSPPGSSQLCTPCFTRIVFFTTMMVTDWMKSARFLEDAILRNAMNKSNSIIKIGHCMKKIT